MSRPQELRITTIQTGPAPRAMPTETADGVARPEEEEVILGEKIEVRDTFRGYTGLYSGEPRRCAVRVNLVYDSPGTPLHRGMLDMERNLRSLMAPISVEVHGPSERAGVNTALSNLSFVTHEECHVSAIDEIWLHRLIETDGLARLSKRDLWHILPSHIKTILARDVSPSPGDDFTGFWLREVRKQYVTQAMTIAQAKKHLRTQGMPAAGRDAAKGDRPGIDDIFAIPLRQNWGILAVSRPSPEVAEEAFKRAFQGLLGGQSGKGGSDDAKESQGSRVSALRIAIPRILLLT